MYFYCCVLQQSTAGVLFEGVLVKLVLQEFLTMAASAGLARISNTHPCTSPAMASLHSAAFFATLLRECTENFAGLEEPGCGRRLYASSGDSLVELIPPVSRIQQPSSCAINLAAS